MLPCLVGVDGKEGGRGRRPENAGHVRLSRGTRERVCMTAERFRNWAENPQRFVKTKTYLRHIETGPRPWGRESLPSISNCSLMCGTLKTTRMGRVRA